MRRNNTGSSLVKGAFLCLNGSVLSGLRKKNKKTFTWKWSGLDWKWVEKSANVQRKILKDLWKPGELLLKTHFKKLNKTLAPWKQKKNIWGVTYGIDFFMASQLGVCLAGVIFLHIFQSPVHCSTSSFFKSSSEAWLLLSEIPGLVPLLWGPWSTNAWCCCSNNITVYYFYIIQCDISTVQWGSHGGQMTN